MRKVFGATCAILATLLILVVGGVVIADAVHLYPAKNLAMDLGKVGLQWRNAVIGNVTATNNTAVNGTATFNGTTALNGPVSHALVTVNATNVTIDGTANSTVVAVVNMSGNHTIVFDPVPAEGGVVKLIDFSGKLGTTGNFTVNATGASICNADNITWTNTTDVVVATGNVSNVTSLDVISDGTDLYVTP